MIKLLNKLKDNKKTQFGTWVKNCSSETIESLSIAGFDFVVLDLEHAPINLETVYQHVVLGQALGMSVLVRMPDSGSFYVQRILDMDVDGVLIPQIKTIPQAEEIIKELIFSPTGNRGYGITSRAGHWGLRSKQDYIDSGNNDLFRCIQLEDEESLRQCANFLDVQGVNAVFLGAGDLALSSGKPATHPDNEKLIDLLLEETKKRNVPCGTAVSTSSAAKKAASQGFNFVMISNDLSIFMKEAKNIIDQISLDS